MVQGCGEYFCNKHCAICGQASHVASACSFRIVTEISPRYITCLNESHDVVVEWGDTCHLCHEEERGQEAIEGDDADGGGE
jgi:hypothetical protein